MRIGKKDQGKSTSSHGGDGGANGPITAANYKDRAIAFLRAKEGVEREGPRKGMAIADGFVIRAYEGEQGSLATKLPATPAQWTAWMAYFQAKGIKHAFAKQRGMTTVPAEWPHQFDGQWVIETPPPLSPPRTEYVSPERRKQLAAMLRGSVAASAPVAATPGLERSRSPQEAEISRRHHEERLAKLTAEYAAKPPAMGDALAKQLAAIRREQAKTDDEDEVDF
jgi:hypothetical protein